MGATDLSGREFGRLNVLTRAGNDRHGKARWLCLCLCSKEKIVPAASLVRGEAQSCGCLHNELVGSQNRTHGLTASPEHQIWLAMKARCYNTRHVGYPNYGGRGIAVSDRWRNSFENFLGDMGPRPSKAHSIERKDSNKNYSPANCVWATRYEQANNKRNNRIVKYQGVRMTLSQAVRLAGGKVNSSTAAFRIRAGWAVAKAVETQARPYVRSAA